MRNYDPPPKCRHKYAPAVWPASALRVPPPQGSGELAIEAKVCRRCGLIRYRFWWMAMGPHPRPASGWGYADTMAELVLGEPAPALKPDAIGVN